MQKLLICIVSCTLLSVLCYADAEIIVPPVDQTVALGQTSPAVFSCYYDGTGFWLVDGTVLHANSPYERELEERGIINKPPVHSMSRVNLTLTVSVTTVLNNNTNLTCLQSESERVSAVLIIAGPPLAPHPNFTIVNSTTVIVHWDKPFTWQQFDIQNYTVKVRNSTTGEVTAETITFGDNRTNAAYSWPLNSTIIGYMMTNNGSIAYICHEVQFNVTASNAIGESSAGQVSGGFPIAPGPFNTTEIWHKVTFDVLLNPKIEINFTFPLVCYFQRANYTISLFKQHEEYEVVFTTGPRPYDRKEDGTHVKVSVEEGLEANMRYTAVIIVETVVGSKNITIDISTMYENSQTTEDYTTGHETSTTPATVTDSTSDTGQTSSSKIILGVVTGGVIFVLLLAILIVSLCIIIIRQRTLKRRDLIQNTELSVAKACEKMEANPIYSSESPIYDVIVDTPMLRSLPREPQRKTDMDPGQYVELSVNGVSEKMTRNDSMSVESNKLAECCASRQKAFKPGSLEETYTIMNPAGTVRSCPNNNQQSATSPVNGQAASSCCQCELTIENGGQDMGGTIGCHGGHGFKAHENRYVTTIKN